MWKADGSPSVPNRFTLVPTLLPYGDKRKHDEEIGVTEETNNNSRSNVFWSYREYVNRDVHLSDVCGDSCNISLSGSGDPVTREQFQNTETSMCVTLLL